MAIISIKQTKSECIGCGACESVAPKYWKVKDDGKAVLIQKDSNGEEIEIELDDDADIEALVEAAEVCPVNCIHISKDGEKKV